MKWTVTFCLFFIHTFSYAQRAEDSLAIVKLLEKASATFRSGDAKGYADCWKIQPYSVILVSTADGKAFSTPAEAMVHSSPYMGKGGFSVMTNYKMSIFPGNGWVSFDEESTSKEGAKSYSYEMWMVEKINGEWKLVAASMHFYKKP